MAERTIEKVKRTTAESRVMSGGIVYAVHTGQCFCLNEPGLRLLYRFEQGLSYEVLNRPGVHSVVTLLEQAQALEHGNGQIRLRTGALRVYPYNKEAQYLSNPISVMLEVTPACDLRCVYCCVAELDDLAMGRALSRQEMANVVDAIAGMGASSVTITGGEPLMRQRSHGDLFDIIRRLRSYGIRVSLFTNGTMLADYADQILECGVAEMSVSLDASTPQLFERLTRRPYFGRVIAGLRAIAHHGIVTRVAMVITRLNAHDWPNMLELIQDIGLDALMMLRAYPIGRACKDPSFIVDDARWVEIAREVIAYARDKGYKTGGGRDLESGVLYPFGNCKAGTTFCIVNYDGTVCPCCGFKTTLIGDLRQESFEEVWTSPNWDMLRNKQFSCPVPDRDVLLISVPKA